MQLITLLCAVLPLALAIPTSSSAHLPALTATTQSCSIYGNAVVQCYEGPGDTYSAAATVHGGHFYSCKCSKVGEDVNGNTNWDFIPEASLPGGGCYVAQYYTTTPCGNCEL